MPEPLDLLIVDDEPDTEALFTQQFRHERKSGALTMRFARSADAALAAMDERTPDCVLILSDIHMPGMNGLELLRRVKRQHPGLRVLMLATPGDESEEQVTSLGADGCVAKPIDFAELRQKVFQA